MLFYRLGDIMMFAMSKPLLRDLGVDTAHRGLLNGLGTGASILGVVLGGAFVARRGLERALVPLIYVQNLGIPLYIGMAVWKPHLPAITAIVLVEQLVGGFGMAGATVFLMQRCRRAFSASHFAMATSVVSLASTFSGYASGPLNERLGTPGLLHRGIFGQRSQPGAGPPGAEDGDRGRSGRRPLNARTGATVIAHRTTSETARWISPLGVQ